MASKDQVLERRKNLLSYLAKHDAVSVEELLKQINISKRTLMSDISGLRDSGNIIHIKKDNIMLQKEVDVVAPSSKAIMRRIKILYIISLSNGITKNKLLKKLISADHEFMESEKEEMRWIDKVRKNLENDLKVLSSQKMIYTEDHEIKVSLSTPVIEKMNDRILLDIYDAILNNGDANAYSIILNQIAKKLADAMKYKLLEEPDNAVNSILINRNVENVVECRDKLKILFSLPYKTNMIWIEFVNRYGKKCSQTIAIEKLVYLCDNGKIYIIGRQEDQEYESIIQLSRITNIKKVDKINNYYDSDRIQKICREMLMISVEEPVKVQVEFDNKFQIKEKVELLSKNRPDSKIVMQKDKIIYFDFVRGMDDFAKILRGFGQACKVIEPEQLVKKMYESSCRVLERYTENE